MGDMLDSKYLPFTEEQLLAHFAKVRYRGQCIRKERHLNYYRDSVRRYHAYLMENPDRRGIPLSMMKRPCQVEKDERFWVASCMMTMFHNDHRQQLLSELFTMAYGEAPPLKGLNSWEKCLGRDLNLFFEVNLPSPISYKEWLFRNLRRRHSIPHVLESAYGKRSLEGPTDVDALLLNSRNGFAVIVEAKVLSDISYQITYDITRNQMARIIDVMLEENKHLCEPLSGREPERTLFLLLTPEFFKTNSSSRLYGYKFKDYKENPESIAADLPHRKDRDWQEISERLGWLTWEDFHRVDEDCCPWISNKAPAETLP